jgi:hypothetical protein
MYYAFIFRRVYRSRKRPRKYPTTIRFSMPPRIHRPSYYSPYSLRSCIRNPVAGLWHSRGARWTAWYITLPTEVQAFYLLILLSFLSLTPKEYVDRIRKQKKPAAALASPGKRNPSSSARRSRGMSPFNNQKERGACMYVCMYVHKYISTYVYVLCTGGYTSSAHEEKKTRTIEEGQ